jgi:hypothetical protein
MSQLQRELHAQLRAESAATRERIATMVRPLDGAKLVAHPEPKGWSVGEILEHLCVSEEAYEPSLARVFREARPDAGAPAREWKPTFIGNLLANVLQKPKPVKTRPVFEPGATPRNGVVESLLASEQVFVKRMDDAASLDWNAVKVPSPALPSWFLKFNLGDVFKIHVVHVARHARQIERVAGKL